MSTITNILISRCGLSKAVAEHWESKMSDKDKKWLTDNAKAPGIEAEISNRVDANPDNSVLHRYNLAVQQLRNALEKKQISQEQFDVQLKALNAALDQVTINGRLVSSVGSFSIKDGTITPITQ